MNDRLRRALSARRDAGQNLLMCALVAADPHIEATLDFMRVLADRGADIIELIFPFSDPTYHGPVIQRACARALREEVSWQEVGDLGRSFRQTHDTPVVFTTYYNRVLARGTNAFATTLEEAGFDAALVTDLPWDESARLRDALAQRDLVLIASAAPTTPVARFERIAADAEGFIVWTGHSGGDVTISENLFQERMAAFRSRTQLPLLASMKISTGAEAGDVAGVADGVLVGSAIIWLVEGRGPDLTERIGQFVAELREHLDRVD